jgi:hypothetical protein
VPFTATPGVNYVTVTAYDRAKNASRANPADLTSASAVTYKFKVGTLTPSSQWQMNEGAGTAAANGVSGGQPLTLSALGASWGDGRYYDFESADRALALDGVMGVASTSNWVLDTSKPFSVGISAFVDADAPTNATYVALSQNSVNTSGLRLGYRNGYWFFEMPTSDSVSAPMVSAPGVTPAENPLPAAARGEWVQLTAVYDGTSLRLYVNGDLYGPDVAYHTAFATMPGSGLPLRLGSGRTTEFWRGRLDMAKTFAGVLTDDQIITLASEPFQLQ